MAFGGAIEREWRCTLTKQPNLPDPARFGMQSFAELLSTRPEILGEVQGRFDAFREGMIASLLRVTPYECVVAENLIAIDWEMVQRRRMRDAELRTALRSRVLDAIREQHPSYFTVSNPQERSAAKALGDRCLSNDPAELAEMEAELAAQGISRPTLMSDA